MSFLSKKFKGEEATPSPIQQGKIDIRNSLIPGPRQATLKSGNRFALPNLVSRSLTSEEEWLTTEQAAAYLKLSVGSLRNMTSNGQIPYHKLGKRNRYRLSDLRELLLSQKRGGF